jgi:phosphoribosylglycinamide formyltransferase-1
MAEAIPPAPEAGPVQPALFADAPPAPVRVGVLVSGRGSNLAALLAACAGGTVPAAVVLVVCNHSGAGALDIAAAHGVPAVVIPRAGHPTRAAQQAAMIAALDEQVVDLVVCAGFDRILEAAFCAHYAGRLINVHPSLLPAFGGGLHAVADALSYGVRVTGVTVHFVTDDLDNGPIILQEAVSVLPDDTPATLAPRLHAVEHRLLPEAVRLYAEGRLRVEGRRVIIT